MHATECIIPVRSEQEAMDWSLVLASQAIASTIQRPNEDHGWHLVVSWEDYRRALQAIRLYRLENRRSIWHQPLPMGDWILDWRAAGWGMLLVLFYYLAQMANSSLTQDGMMDTQAVRAGAWWRLFTATMLHADIAHLAGNVTLGFLLLGMAMSLYGFGWAWLAAYLAGVGGNVAGLLLHLYPHRALGASGMVMGALGLLAIHTVSLAGMRAPGRKYIMRGLLAGGLMLVLMGLDPASDVVAHVGGFFSGVILGWLLGWLPDAWRRRSLPNLMAELLVVSLILITWWLALQ